MQGTLIKKPIAIRVYQFRANDADTVHGTYYRVESFTYHVKKEEPIRLLETYVCQEEEEVIAYTNRLKNLYDVRDFYRFYAQDEEVEYQPHRRLHQYNWSTVHLEDIFNQHIRQMYDYEACVSVKYDIYERMFNVFITLNDDGENYEELVQSMIELYVTEEELKKYPQLFQKERFEFNFVWKRMLSDIIGKKFGFCRLQNEYLYSAEYTWSHDDAVKAEFFFRE